MSVQLPATLPPNILSTLKAAASTPSKPVLDLRRKLGAPYDLYWIALFRQAPPIEPYGFVVPERPSERQGTDVEFEVACLPQISPFVFLVYHANGRRYSGAELPLSTVPGARLYVKISISQRSGLSSASFYMK